MNKEQSIKALQISAILFKYNVPIAEAKFIGLFIEELIQENQKLKSIYKASLHREHEAIHRANDLEDENQKLKEMQCTFLGTGCQNKMKKYKEVIDKVNKLIAENSEKYWIDDEGEPKYLFNEIRDILSEVE